MERFADIIIRHRKLVIIFFTVLTVICALVYLQVPVNYNVADYLPQNAQSTVAVRLMSEEFKNKLPNAEVTVYDVSLPEAALLKQELAALAYVNEVIWLDDVADILIPLPMQDKNLVGNYYKNGAARYSVVIEKSREQEAAADIKHFFTDNTIRPLSGVITGEAADMAVIQEAATSEVLGAMMILVPVIIFLLIISTASWAEPFLFLAAVGVSVAVNMGTNIFMEDVSFLTNSVTPILQLAVSLDYAIFLLHAFGARRQNGADTGAAMRGAVKESFSAVSASAATTLFGFMALMFMDFRIGSNLGTSLAKGIMFSFISVMVFLPALTVCLSDIIDKTHHRAFMPDFKNVQRVLSKFAVPVIAVVGLIIVPCYLAQSRTDFMYGYDMSAEETSAPAEWDDTRVIAVLVPKGDIIKEEMLCDDILSIPLITSVVAYPKTVGSAIPPGFLDDAITDQFYGENYTRILVYTNTPKEGDIAFDTVRLVTQAAEKYYPGNVYTAGESANLRDVKTVAQNDNTRTDIIATGLILLVLIITFRSGMLPLCMLFTIKAAIWINLSVPYFTGTTINYVGYLVLNTVQLGATIDYAVLLAVTYMRNRKSLLKKEAIYKTLGDSFSSIVVSASILATAGFTLAATTSNPIVADIGTLLGRGAILSFAMVIIFLPALLALFDGLIKKTTYKADFFEKT